MVKMNDKLHSFNETEALDFVNQYLEEVEDLRKKYEVTIESNFKDVPEYALSKMYEISTLYKQNMTSCVYFLKNNTTGQIKIGYTDDLYSRMRQIKSAFKHIGYECDLELIGVHITFSSLARQLEAIYHNEYEECRKQGEWFDVELSELICDIATDEDSYCIHNGVIVSWSDLEDVGGLNFDKNYNINTLEFLSEIASVPDIIKFARHVYKIHPFEYISPVVENKIYRIYDLIINEGIIFTWESKSKERTITAHTMGKDGGDKLTYRILKNMKLDDNYWNKTIEKVNVVLAR